MPLRVAKALAGLFRDFVSACWAILRLPFRLIGIGWREVIGLGWRRILLLSIAAVLVTILATVVMVEATSQPGFCISCHVMRPYFADWRASKHNGIECTKCHVPPGLEGTVKHKFMALSMVANYFTGLYKRSKPWAEIEDASCLREGCHQTRLLQGKEAFKGVLFDHEPHIIQPRRDRQLRCTSCHAQIVQGAHIAVTEGTCFLCHFKPDSSGKPTELARCTHCHNPPAGPAAADTAFDHTSILARNVDCLSCHVSAVAGDGYVPPDRCNTCHARREHIERYGDLEFVHTMHVTENKVECLNCHIAIRHGKSVDTGVVPEERCNTCHGRPDDAMTRVWEGRLPGLPPAPSTMSRAGMTCISCHAEPIHGEDQHRKGPRCVPCHGEEYERLWKLWQGPLTASLARLEAETKRLPEPGRSQLLAALEVYRRGLPIHNPDLVHLLEAQVSPPPAGAGQAECVRCHPAAIDGAPLWNDKPVKHRPHAEAGVACTVCHETEQPLHGRLKLGRSQCNECHHRRAASGTECKTCHELQPPVYAGTLAGQPEPAPSAMFTAEVACTDCHTLTGNQVTRRDPETCAACHTPDYADSLTVWQAQGDALLARAQRMIQVLRASDPVRAQYVQLASTLKRDGSRTAHNPRLFIEWMKRIEQLP